MLIRIRLAAAVLALCATCSIASADEKSHRKAAEELLKVMGTEDQLQKSLDQVLEIQAKSNPQLAPFKEVMRTFFAKYLSWEGLKEDMIGIYVAEFSEDELNQIKAFYLTPVGKKLAAKLPELAGKGMQLGASRVQANQAELQKMIRDEAARPR